MIEAFVAGLMQVFTWPTFPLMLIGIAVGFAVGILPGIGGPVALALMLPFVFTMTPVEAIPIVRPLVLSFGSPEFFALALLGITFVAALSGTNKLKGMIMGGVGLVFA